ncbi:TonB-dependent receptor [Altererythrobacter sp. H2]|uniref:TonB-dependent receptor domain-containing protein n=1 Tax=Altererythrobacter sp. H2 TaxID=3108391 RepID=UPI002B4BD7B9|nr:TonB-dependent receptor [Altererythrobacter sp. H2]WRK95402.1 TonB-dependent receptor [Altererythrobacter sp. H2]
MKISQAGVGGRVALMASVAMGAVALSQPVYAQDAAEEEQPAAEAPASDDAIVVTGSRIRSVTPFNSPDPISVLDPEVAKKEGRFDLASTLQTSPIAAGSTQITSAISSNFVTNGGPGAQTVDLRGLGANRTLVLLNGRRAGPAGTRGGVSSFDLNVLPLSIINDIQILKTGASSVYGSDAVAGVVNIFTKNKLDGLTLDLNTSVPFDSGGEQYRISGAWGKTFDRGHFMIAGDYSKTQELSRGDRGYLACPEANIFDESGNRADLIDPRTGQPHCEDLRWGHIWTYNLIDNLRLDGPGGPDTGIQTSPGGRTVLLQYQYPSGAGGGTLGIPAYGAPAYVGDFYAPQGWFPTGYDSASMAVQNAYHPFVDEQTIIPETDLYTIYAEGAFEIADSVELFGEFLFNRRETYQNGWRQFWNFGYTGDLYSTGAGNAYNLWGDGFGGINFISPTGITNLSDNSQKVDYYRGVGGVRGDFGANNNWRYEVHGQYSRSIGRYRSQQILQDAYDSGYFQTASCVGTTLPVSGKQCIDIPWTDPFFLRGELTPEQAAFLTDWEEGKTVYTQLSGEATVSGELFQLPAGPMAIALGASIREDKINDRPGEITLAANAWGASASGVTAGKSLTTEAFAEINVPLLSDKPFFEELNFSAAGRVTNVKATRERDGVSDEDNGNWTYKLGLNWSVTDWLRFRGSFGTSYRAPALFEQFLADETSFTPQNRIDPCVNWGGNLAAGTISQRLADNCAADGIPNNYGGGGISATTISSGGLGILEAETSEALVIGTILTPRFAFLPDTNLSLAVDFFDIKVEGEISQLGAGTILFGCYDSENFANEPLCDLFNRGQNATAVFQIDTVRDSFINVSSQRNQGIDVAFRAEHDFGSIGRLSLTADMTWQLKDDSRLLPTSPLTSDNGEAGSPEWVGDFRATWAHPSGFSLFYGLNVIGATSDQQDFEDRIGGPCLRSFNNQGTASTADDLPIYGVYCPDLTTPATFYHNISMTQDIADGRFTITAGINNLFDTRPPRVSVLNGNQIGMLGPVVAASQYGFVGRRAFINVGAKF